MFAVVTVLVLAVDQVTKWAAVTWLQGEGTIQILGDLFGLTFVLNPGAALGTGAGYTVVLTAIAVGVSVVLLFVARRLRDAWWAIGFGLFLGGALGNLADRLFREPGFGRGHVVDFLDYAGFFVGNVADVALTAAAIVIIWRSWRGVGLDGMREERS